MRALEPVGDNLIAKWGRPAISEAERQDMYKLALAILAEGYLCHVDADPARPRWAPLWNIAFNQGGPNPDYVYLSAVVAEHGTYEISGFRGTTRFVEIAQHDWEVLTAEETPGPIPATNDFDDLTLAEDGRFSVLLSSQRPEAYTGDWWQLHPGVNRLVMRMCSADWANEVDARVAINRLDDAPARTTEETVSKFAAMPMWVEGMISFDMQLVRYYRDHHPRNGIARSKKVDEMGALPNQLYYDGIYEIDDDEALIVETELPRSSRYWQFLVADDRFATVDWVNRQSSLNDVQARRDTDGKVRIVVSARDPSVPNWLDKADNTWGVLQLRWNKPSDAPDPVVTRVLLSDVRRHLPADTPVVAPEQRRDQLRRRREAAQLRRLW